MTFHGEASSGVAMDWPAVGLPKTTMPMMAISVPGRPRAPCRAAVAAAAANTTRMPTPARAALNPLITPSAGPNSSAPAKPEAAA